MVSTKKLKALVLWGDGINCEGETQWILNHVGFETEQIHVNDFLKKSLKSLSDYKLLVFPGGFSFGDELGSGKVLSLKLKTIPQFLEKIWEADLFMLGICNGFQVLMELGVFEEKPLDKEARTLALAPNFGPEGRQGYINRWVKLKTQKNDKSPWLAGLCEELWMPIRHGEGRLITSSEKGPKLSPQVAFRYERDMNGSFDQVAGLLDTRGKILGLMPHPEASVQASQLPGRGQPLKAPLGRLLFENFYRNLGT